RRVEDEGAAVGGKVNGREAVVERPDLEELHARRAVNERWSRRLTTSASLMKGSSSAAAWAKICAVVGSPAYVQLRARSAWREMFLATSTHRRGSSAPRLTES